MEALARELPANKNVHLSAIADRFSSAVARLKEATLWIVEIYGTKPAAVAAGSVYYLKLMGITCGGWMLAALRADRREAARRGRGRRRLPAREAPHARVLRDHILPQALGLSATTMRGADSVLAVEDALL
jgi:hypothetical protein